MGRLTEEFGLAFDTLGGSLADLLEFSDFPVSKNAVTGLLVSTSSRFSTAKIFPLDSASASRAASAEEIGVKGCQILR